MKTMLITQRGLLLQFSTILSVINKYIVSNVIIGHMNIILGC